MNASTPPEHATTAAARAGLRWGHAFTLLELVVVMIVVTAMAAVGAARYSASVQRHRVSLAASQMRSDLRAARAQAIAQSASVRFHARAGHATYAWQALSGPGAGQRATRDLAQDPWGAVVSALQGTGDGRVDFNGFGTPDAAASFTIARGELRCVVTLDAGGAASTGAITRDASRIIVEMNQGGGQSVQSGGVR